MQSSSQGRYGYPGYQGYPYVNPVVHDVPSIDPQTASRWANLPRRPLDSPSVSVPGSSSAGGSSSQSQPSRSSSQERQGSRYQGYPYVTPVYNDVSGSMSPGGSGSGSTAANSSQASQRPQTPGTTTSDTVPPKKDIDENPVVYIDMPEAGSEVSRSIGSPADDDDEPEFVHNTIMYDPFENRRIDMPKDEERTVASSSEAGGSSSGYTQQQFQNSPMRPSTLNIAGGSGSSTQSPASTSRQTPIIPSFMSKESQVYGGSDGADGFPLSPIPISEFPEPPPAYTEVDERSPSRAVESPRAETPRAVEPPPPPRTQVIVNEQCNPLNRPMPIASPVNSQTPITSPLHGPIAAPVMNPMPVQMPIMAPQNYLQKHLLCHHCGTRVYTIVDKEVGPMTHFVACMVFFIFLPFVIIVYIADYFKYKNHYCSNCFKLIGYETPIVGQKVTYVT